MAKFLPVFESTLLNEGGYRLTNDPRDSGGMTYAGISRRAHPKWPGWGLIDAGKAVPASMVMDFYSAEYWVPCGCDRIDSQDIARNIFDFSVNAGVSTAVKLAQIVAGATPDGDMGPKTIAAINAFDPVYFRLSYALMKIARYRDIVQRRPKDIVYLIGWINRTLKEASA